MPTSVLKIDSKTALEIAAITNMAVGDVVFQTTDPVGFYTYDGSTWIMIEVNPNLASKLQFKPLVSYTDVDSQSPDIVTSDTYNSVTLNSKGRILSASKVTLDVADNLTGTLPTNVLPAFTGDITTSANTNIATVSKINSVVLDTTLPTDKQSLVFDALSNTIKWETPSSSIAGLTGILPTTSLPSITGDVSIAEGTNVSSIVKINSIQLDTTLPIDKQALVYDMVSNTLKWTTIVDSVDATILIGTLPIASLPAFVGDVVVNAGTNITNIKKLNGVVLDTTAPTDKQALVYDNATSKLKWTTLINSTDAGILTGTLPTTVLPAFTGDVTTTVGTNTTKIAKINGVTIDTTAPTNKQVFVYDSTSLKAKWGSLDVSTVTGTLPNTSLPAFTGDVTVAIGTSTTKLAKINGITLDTTLPTDKQILVYDNTALKAKWGSLDISTLTGTLSNTLLPAFTGDVTVAVGTSTTKLAKINGIALDTTAPTDKQVLVYDNAALKAKWGALDASTLTGTLSNTILPAFTGDVTVAVGTSITKIAKINGTALDTTAPADKQVLVYDNTALKAKWGALDISTLTGTLPLTVLPAFTGDVTSTIGTSTTKIAKINGIALDTTVPVDKQVLVYDNTALKAKWGALDVSTVTGVLPLTSLPALTGDVTTTVGTNITKVAKLNGVALDTTAPTLGQAMKYDGTKIVWYSPDATVIDSLPTVNTIAKRTSTAALNATQFVSSEAVLAPLTVASKVKVSNLNAEYISDTKITNVSTANSLLFGGDATAAWATVTGDINVNLDNSITVSKLNGIAIDTTLPPVNNQIFSYNGTDAIWSSLVDDSLLSANIPKLVNGLLDPSVIPPLSITNVDVYTSDATGLAVGYTDNDLVNNTISKQVTHPTFAIGDVIVLSDLSKTFILSSITDSVYTWTLLVTPMDGVATIGDQTGIITKLKVSNINIQDNTVNGVVNNTNALLTYDATNGAKWSPLDISTMPVYTGTDIITNSTSKLLELTTKFTGTKNFATVNVDTKGRITNGIPITNTATANMVLTSDGTNATWKTTGLVDVTVSGTMGTDSLLFSTAANTAAWRNLSGDISIKTDKSIAVNKINGITINGTPAIGAVITADSTSTATWVVPQSVKVVTVDFISSYYTNMVNTQYAISITGVVSLTGVLVDHFLIHMDDGVNITEFTLPPDTAGGNTATYLATTSATPNTTIVTITAYDTAGNKSDPVSKTYRTVINLPPLGTITANVVASVAGGSTGNTISFGGATDNENNQIYYKVTPKTTTAFTFSKSIGILPNEQITFSVPLVASAMDISFIVTAYDTFGGTENDGTSKTFSVSVTTNVIGVANTNPVLGGGLGGSYVHADMNGATLIKTQSYFDMHPCYQFTPVTIDGQSMITIPKFYYKVDKILSGTNANKYGLWISDIKLSDSWNVHPAFMNNGVEIPYFYYGKYQASVDYSNPASPKLKSVGGVVPEYNSVTMNDYKTFANNRNASGVSGFMVHSFWQRSAIQMLALVEKNTLEMASTTNRGAYVTVANDQIFPINVSLSGGSYRGIEGLWGNVSQLVDGLYVLNQALYVWDTTGARDVNGDFAYITQSGYTVPIDSVATKFQYPITFKAGSFFDACFITESNTVQSVCNVYDLQFFRKSSLTTKYFATVGGSASEANNAVIDANWTSNTDRIGMYYLKCAYAADADLSSLTEYVGTRLAKI